MLNNLFIIYFALTDLIKEHDVLPPPKDWVQDKIVDYLTPNFVAFLGALAAIAVFRSLLRF